MFGQLNKGPFQEQPQITQEQSDLMERREGVTISIRKEGRQNEILKRRKQNTAAIVPQQEQALSPFQAKLIEFSKKDFNINQIYELGQCLNANDIEKVHYGIIGIRKILSYEKDPPIQLIIDANLVPKIITFAKQSEYSELKSEATWCLSNIASGSTLQTQSVVDKGGLQLFAELLKSNIQLVVEHAVWAIGNIAGDRAVYRDNLMKSGVLDTLCNLINTSKNMKIVTQSCWAISNIIRCKPIPKFEQAKMVIPVLANMILKGNVTNLETIADSIWVFSYLIEYNNTRITFFMQTGVTPKLIQFLQSEDKDIVASSLKALGNVCYGNELHIQNLIENGFIQQLEILLGKSKKVIKREVCWVLSNIAASTQKHVNFLFQHQSLIEKLIEILRSTQRHEIKLEVGMFFSNAASNGDPVFLCDFYSRSGLMSIYLSFLSHQQNIMVEMAIQGISALLKIGNATKDNYGGKSILMEDLENNKGIDLLEDAQLHANKDIYKMTAKLLATYFDIEDPLE